MSSPSYIAQAFGGFTNQEVEPARSGNAVGNNATNAVAAEHAVSEIRVRIVTLNINGESLPNNLKDLVDLSDNPPQLVVFCFQEVMQLSLKRVVRDLVSGRNRGEACDRLRQTLCTALPSNYHEVHAEEMVGLFIIVFCGPEVYPTLRYAQSAIFATGIAGVIGNKGACAVRMKVGDTILVFVNAHLASSEDELERRNEDLQLIKDNLLFPAVPASDSVSSFRKFGKRQLVAGYVEDKSYNTTAEIVQREQESKTEADRRFSILDTDYLFLAGDLNYRITLDHDEVIELINQKRYDILLQHDQLMKQLPGGNVCSQYQEAQINFRPTYKFDKTTKPDRPYDTSEKQRTPSWTDRILYCIHGDAPQLRVETYKSNEEILCSDHLPVALTVLLQHR